jgi:hypothetical protein
MGWCRVTVEDPDKVDSIAVSADGETYTLVMTEERRFDDSDLQFNQLLEKINSYVEYIQLGQFYEDYPQASGRRLEVRLVCLDTPGSERFRKLLNAATELFGRHGADFAIEVIPIELPGR